MVINHSKLDSFCFWKASLNIPTRLFNYFEVIDDLKLMSLLFNLTRSSTGSVKMDKQSSALVSLTSVWLTLLSSRWSRKWASWASASIFWLLLEMNQTSYIRGSKKQTILHCLNFSIQIHIPLRTICPFACLRVLCLLFHSLKGSVILLGGIICWLK